MVYAGRVCLQQTRVNKSRDSKTLEKSTNMNVEGDVDDNNRNLVAELIARDDNNVLYTLSIRPRILSLSLSLTLSRQKGEPMSIL